MTITDYLLYIGLPTWVFGWWYTSTAWSRSEGGHDLAMWLAALMFWPLAIVILLFDKSIKGGKIYNSKMFDFWE